MLETCWTLTLLIDVSDTPQRVRYISIRENVLDTPPTHRRRMSPEVEDIVSSIEGYACIIVGES